MCLRIVWQSLVWLEAKVAQLIQNATVCVLKKPETSVKQLLFIWGHKNFQEQALQILIVRDKADFDYGKVNLRLLQQHRYSLRPFNSLAWTFLNSQKFLLVVFFITS